MIATVGEKKTTLNQYKPKRINKMCFIATIVKLKENNEARNAILEVLESEQIRNGDGTGSLCYPASGKPVIQRDTYMTWVEMENNLKSNNIINYHFRTATVGEKTIKNVHFWKMGDWSFAHNGTIGDMAKGTKSDSLVFFENLIRKGFLSDKGNVKGKKIKEYVNKCTFWGRFLIINTKTKNIYFFGDFELYLLNKSYLVFTSKPADFESKIDVMGLKFDVDESIEKIDSKIDGVWMFDYSKQSFSQIFEKLKEYNYANNISHNHTTRFEDDAYYFGDMVWDKDKKCYVDNPIKQMKEKSETEKAEKALEKAKNRTQKSYKKEFYGRLESEMEEQPEIEAILTEEYQLDEFNEMGRSDVEETYWQLWIAPQLEANGHLDFKFREPTKAIKLIESKQEEIGFKKLFSEKK